MGRFGYSSNMNIDEKVMIAIVRVSESYKKASSSIFRNYGLTFAQYTVLRVLEGSENGQNTMGNVSKVMLVTGANITPIAKRLEKDGFLLKKGDPCDDRLTILELTTKGNATIENIEREKNALVEHCLKECSAHVRSDLLNMVKDILRCMQPNDNKIYKVK